MKNLVLLLVCGLQLIGCKEEENLKIQTPTNAARGVPIVGGNKKMDFYDLSLPGYRGQLPYIVSDYLSSVAEFNTEFEIGDKVIDSATTWEYFDRLYSDELPDDHKQNLAILILSNKDLIRHARDNPQDIRIHRALLKYIDVLVDTKYFGYCLLHSALLESNDDRYISQKASEIASYAELETFHETYLNDPNITDSLRRRKVEEDYNFLPRIRELQQ